MTQATSPLYKGQQLIWYLVKSLDREGEIRLGVWGWALAHG